MAPGLRISERVPGGGAGFRAVLGLPDFRLIWFAQLASQLADKFLLFSLVILAYRVSGGSTPVAVTLLAYTLPAILLGPLAGSFADRHDRRRIMVRTNAIRGALIALIPLGALTPLRGDFSHLLLITLVFSAVGQFFSPAEAAAIPAVVPRRALIAANSLVMVTMVLTLVVGGTLAPVVSRLAIYAPYWCAVALFAVATLLVAGIRLPPPPEVPARETGRFMRVVDDTRDGLATLAGSPVSMLSFQQLSLAVLVMLTIFTLAPAYVSRVLRIEAVDAYVVLGPATVGALACAAVLGQFGRRLDRRALLVGSLAATGATLVMLAAAPAWLGRWAPFAGHLAWLGAGLAFLLGMEFGALMIPALSHLMEVTDDTVRGRVFALLYMVINGVAAVPMLVAAGLADWLGIEGVMAGLGVLVALAGVLAARQAARDPVWGRVPPSA